MTHGTRRQRARALLTASHTCGLSARAYAVVRCCSSRRGGGRRDSFERLEYDRRVLRLITSAALGSLLGGAIIALAGPAYATTIRTIVTLTDLPRF